MEAGGTAAAIPSWLACPKGLGVLTVAAGGSEP
jgi:hypothetical protein